MGKPLEMRGWAIRTSWTESNGLVRTTLMNIAGTPRLWITRKQARAVQQHYRETYSHSPGHHRYTVVPVVVRERR